MVALDNGKEIVKSSHLVVLVNILVTLSVLINFLVAVKLV